MTDSPVMISDARGPQVSPERLKPKRRMPGITPPELVVFIGEFTRGFG